MGKYREIHWPEISGYLWRKDAGINPVSSMNSYNPIYFVEIRVKRCNFLDIF